MGGLTAAARLAAQGHHVTVLEQGQVAGGKCRTYRREGYAFDTGPSLFTLPEVYRDVFAATGPPLDDVLDILPLDPAFRITWSDGASALVPGLGTQAAAAAFGDALGGTAERDWNALMTRAEAMWALTRKPFLESPLGPASLLTLARRPSDVTTVAPFTKLRDLGRRYLGDERLVTLLDRYATYTGSDPRRAPAVFATVPFMEQHYGAWHVAGGLGQLAEALAARCRYLGVELRFGADVEKVTLARGRVSGVRLRDGSELPADAVVANCDAGVLYADLLEHPKAARLANRIQREPASVAGFVLLLAVRGRTPGVAHHNVWFPEDYDDEFDSIFGPSPRPVSDPTIYACVPDDPAMRPDSEHEAWFILINAPAGGDIQWQEPGFSEAYADQILAKLAQRGVDLRDRIEWRELRTPKDYARSVRAPGGAIYGAASHGSRAAFRRPSNRSPIPGLYLVGGSAHPGGGLPLVGLSGAITAGLVEKDRRRATRV